MKKYIKLSLICIGVFILDFISTVIGVGILGTKCNIVERSPIPAFLQGIGALGWILWIFYMICIIFILFFVSSFIGKKIVKFKRGEDMALFITLVCFLVIDGICIIGNTIYILRCLYV